MRAGLKHKPLSDGAVLVAGIVLIGLLWVRGIEVYLDWVEWSVVRVQTVAEMILLFIALGGIALAWFGLRSRRRAIEVLETNARLTEKVPAEIALRDMAFREAGQPGPQPVTSPRSNVDEGHLGAGFAIDADGRCTFCNPAAARLLGHENPETVIGEPLLARILADGEAGLISRMQTLRQGERLTNQSVVLRHRDGTEVRRALSCRPIEKAGAFAGAICWFQNPAHEYRQSDALVESEERFLAVAEASPIGLAITRLSDGMFVFANAALEILLQYPEGGLSRMRSVELYIDADERADLLREACDSGQVVSREIRLRRYDGSHIWVFLSVRSIAVGEESLIAAAIMDISERRKAEETLRKLSLAVEQSPVTVVMTDAEGAIEYVNPKFVEVTGYQPEEVIGKNPRILKSGSTSPEHYRELWQTIKAGKAWRGELLNRNKAGDKYWVSSSISPITAADGTISHFVAVGEDITVRKRYEERLLHRANYDQLTDLPNRVLVLERLRRALDRAKRARNTVTVAFIDLDDFKKINDTLGHAAGDDLIIEAAKRLSQCIRSVDTVGRLGGDEFLVVLSDLTSQREAERIIDRIITVFREPFRIEDQLIHFTASIGLTVYPIDGDDPHVLLRNADAAMFRAKQAGRNRFKFFTADMNERAQRRLLLESTLRDAIDSRELHVVYQPIINLDSSRPSGAEALLRWQSPRLGTVSPAEFIAVAEESGLIDTLGSFVLNAACCQCKEWQGHGGRRLRVAVNVSSIQFRNGNILSAVGDALIRWGLSPDFLELEITESLLLTDDATTLQELHDLKALGVHLSIDDFGTGYSSLAYLKRFPIDMLKIDRSFVRDVANDPEDAALCRAIVAMAHSLGMTVVAEGVETHRQLASLRDEGCDLVQGFLFGQPLTPADLAIAWEAWFAERPKLLQAGATTRR